MCDYRRGLDWWLDLLTTYKHNSELQAITAPPLISTIHKSPQHPLSIIHLAVSSPIVLWQRLLIMKILRLHALRFYLHSLIYRTPWQLTFSLLITSRHWPRRNDPFPTETLIIACLFIAAGTCSLSRCRQTVVVTESSLSNWSIRHSIVRGVVQVWYNWRNMYDVQNF
jgi:hypothetical protein